MTTVVKQTMLRLLTALAAGQGVLRASGRGMVGNS